MNDLLTACGPEFLLLGAVALITVFESIWPAKGVRAKVFLGLTALAGAFLLLPATGTVSPDMLAGLWSTDPLSVVFKLVILVAAILSLFMAAEEIEKRSAAGGEFVILVLLAAVGMMIMASGIDLIVILLGLELMAVSFYILAGFTWIQTCPAL